MFGGYDGKKNHSNLRIFDTESLKWIKTKKPGGPQPLGRNGHTATLVGKFNLIKNFIISFLIQSLFNF